MASRLAHCTDIKCPGCDRPPRGVDFSLRPAPSAALHGDNSVDPGMPIFGSAWRLWFGQGIIVTSRQSSLEKVGRATCTSESVLLRAGMCHAKRYSQQRRLGMCLNFVGRRAPSCPTPRAYPGMVSTYSSTMSQAYCCLRRVANARGEYALERLRRVWAWSGVVAQRKHRGRRAPTLTSQNIRSPALTRLGERHRSPHVAHAQDDTPFSSGVIQLCDVYTESVRGQTTTFQRKGERLCTGGRPDPCPQESKKVIRKSCNKTVRSI